VEENGWGVLFPKKQTFGTLRAPKEILKQEKVVRVGGGVNLPRPKEGKAICEFGRDHSAVGGGEDPVSMWVLLCIMSLSFRNTKKWGNFTGKREAYAL